MGRGACLRPSPELGLFTCSARPGRGVVRGLGPPSFLPPPASPLSAEGPEPPSLLPPPAVAVPCPPQGESALRVLLSVSLVTSSTFLGAGVEWVLLSTPWPVEGVGTCSSPAPGRRPGPPGRRSDLGSVVPMGCSPLGELPLELLVTGWKSVLGDQ